MSYQVKTSLCIFTALLFETSLAFAGAGVTYYGRLLKSNSAPVSSSVVQFHVQIRTPGNEDCLLYQETHTRDMSAGDGIFAITIGDGTASVVNTEPFTLDRAFQNRGTFSFGAGKCTLGNSYAPNATDGRKLFVEFNDGTFAGFEALPAQSVNFVPMALEAVTLNGYGSGSLLRVNDGSGAPASISALTQIQYNHFLDLLGGSSSLYLTSSSSLNGANLTAGSVDDSKLASGISGSKISGNISGNAAGFTGSLSGDVTGPQSTTSVVKIRGRDIDTVAPTNGQVLKWNASGSRWEAQNDNTGTGTVTSVTGTGAVVMSGTSADPIVGVQDASTSVKGVVQLSANGGTTAGQVVQANDSRLNDARAPTSHHHVVDEIDSAASKYFSYKPNNVACANGELLQWNLSQTRWECGTASSSESTTASNIGTAGVGVFKQLSSYDLQFKKLNAASSALSLTDDTANNKIDIGVNAELGGLANLGANGFVKRTAAGTYSTASSIGIPELNMNGLMGNNTGLLVSDGTQLQNKACSPNQILKWLSPSGWTCAADDGLTTEVDPKVGANTLNYLSKWNGSALVASGILENGSGNVGIGTSSPTSLLEVKGAGGTSITYAGSGTTKFRMGQNGTGDDFSFRTNWSSAGVVQDDAAKPGWALGMGPAADAFQVYRLAPGAGSSNLFFTINSVGNVGIGTTLPASSLDLSARNDAVALPAGSTAQRPSAKDGMIRYNGDVGGVEVRASNNWHKVMTQSTMDLTFYVRTDGNDIDCNGSADVAYSAGAAPACAVASPQRAIDIMPAYISHLMTVNIRGGTYYVSPTANDILNIAKITDHQKFGSSPAPSITIQAIPATGAVILSGATAGAPTTAVALRGVLVQGPEFQTMLRNITVQYATGAAIEATGSGILYFDNVTASNSGTGLLCTQASSCYIQNGTLTVQNNAAGVSIGKAASFSTNGAGTSLSITGTGSGTGLYCSSAANCSISQNGATISSFQYGVIVERAAYMYVGGPLNISSLAAGGVGLYIARGSAVDTNGDITINATGANNGIQVTNQSSLNVQGSVTLTGDTVYDSLAVYHKSNFYAYYQVTGKTVSITRTTAGSANGVVAIDGTVTFDGGTANISKFAVCLYADRNGRIDSYGGTRSLSSCTTNGAFWNGGSYQRGNFPAATSCDTTHGSFCY